MTRKRIEHDRDKPAAGTGSAPPPSPGVWPLGELGEATLRQWAAAHRHRFVEVRVAPNADRRAFLLALGQAFAFPAWYGANLDALYDCLTDLPGDVPADLPGDRPEPGAARGCVVLIVGLSPRHRHEAVLEVLADAARQLAEQGYELRVLVASARRD